VGKNLGYRGWFYFRIGWSTYFAFLFAAVNTLTVTYYLAIDNYPILKELFPSFDQYVLFVIVIGVPILVFTGYAHYKKTRAFRSEVDIWIESNPYQSRWLVNSEMTLQLNMKLMEFIIKSSKGEKLNSNELQELIDLKKQFSEHMTSRTLDNKKDKELFPK
jgi:hypothetical protein|tara:strand:+ start:86 stop:568 length:483 start_codon:yes stop_codon:yes gene_type:complete